MCQPNHREETTIWLDKELQRMVKDIVVGESSFFGDLQLRVTSLSIRVWGLSLYSILEVLSYDFVASMTQSWEVLDHILRDNEIYGMNYDFDRALLVIEL